MKIADLQKLAVNDYPRKLGCVVSTKGCNYRCPWCYAINSVIDDEIEEEKDFGREPLSSQYVFDFLKEKRGVLQACTIGGGEPTIHQDLPDFCQKIKKLGYKIKIDTNGSNPQMLEYLLKRRLVDYVAMDIKAPKEKYAEIIGFSGYAINYLFDNLERSISILKSSGFDYEFHTTATPFLYKSDILEIVHWIRPARKYILRTFRPGKTIHPDFASLGAYSPKYLATIKNVIAPFFDECEVRVL